MIGERELFAMIGRLEAEALREWVELGLVQGAPGEAALAFDEADVARVRLICELRYELDVEEESLPVVLSLMDQIYDLRRSVRALAAAHRRRAGRGARAHRRRGQAPTAGVISLAPLASVPRAGL